MTRNHVSNSSLLSRDIKLLGGLLGQIIREQHGSEAFDLVEAVRHAALERRNQVPNAAEKLAALIEQTNLAEKQILINRNIKIHIPIDLKISRWHQFIDRDDGV